MLRDVPVQTAVICCCALRNIYTCDAQGFLGDWEWRGSGGWGHGVDARDKDEFVVGTYRTR
jgi:hypothetical protein